jgi:catechol 2,3-dioxygenase-like lactoylglutathione lyase family enzyme
MKRWCLVLIASFAFAGEHGRIVTAVDSIGLTVSDLERSVEFYSKVLNFEKVSEIEVDGDSYEHLTGVFGLRMRIARMKLGDESIELTEFLAPAWNPGAGGIRAFYFYDPDGHPLEVLCFPVGKGAAKWHASTDRLFLGIHHTAIVISDTEASLRFYRDRLGMDVAGESENFGPEQERLNNVFGARLRITALRAASGPGIEFLEYLAPRDGRPYPPEEKANDLIHWHTRFLGSSADEAARTLRDGRSAFVSTGAVELPDGKAGFRKAITVRDPDGHAIQIAEK